MKRTLVGLMLMALLLVGAAGTLSGQEQAPATKVFFGPVLGVGAVVMDPPLFNATMQAVYANAQVTYFPVFTEMGVESAQVFPLGDSKSSLSIHEMFLISGLDQNMPVPSVELLFGYRIGAGLELGMGPHFSLTAPGGSVKIGASVTYWVGWTISSHGYAVPIKLTFVPMPSYANPQIALLAGFSFETLE